MGSNTQQTAEYFSKALGEKTIYRESTSVNKDKDDWKQGKSISDQNLARALLTPDEIKRMDVDQCIIYEKGLKPIKAQKYYYFKYNTAKEIKPFAVDHNNREDIDRGKWRKYNPYNPYVEEDEKTSDLKIEQLDDLFKDEESNDSAKDNINGDAKEQVQNDLNAIPSEDKSNVKKTEVDLRKELEAKFDELFGSLNDAD